MARTFKQPPRQNLLRVPVLIEDPKSHSEYFEVSELNRIFHAGRNGFLIRGSQFLTQGSQISIEVLDRFNNPVFCTPVDNFSEGGSRAVSIEIFQKTLDGPGKLVILGVAETFADGRDIPEEWRNRTNVRWVVPIQIETKNQNTSPLRLTNEPTAIITERDHLTIRSNRTTRTSSLYTATLTYDHNVQSSDGYAITMQRAGVTDGLGKFFDTTRSSSLVDKGIFTGSLYKRVVDVDPHTNKNAANTTVVSDYTTASVSMSLDKVLNETTAITNTPIIFGDKTDYLNPTLISGSFIRILETSGTRQRIEEYTSSVVYQYVSESVTDHLLSTSSFFNFRIPFVQTSTGEISKVKVFAKESNEALTSFQPLTEYRPGERNLITSSSVSPLNTNLIATSSNAGVFSEKYILDNNWFAADFNTADGFNQTDYESNNTASVSVAGAAYNSDASGLLKRRITHNAVAGIKVGMRVSAAAPSGPTIRDGIPPHAIVASVDSTTQFTLSADTDGGNLSGKTLALTHGITSVTSSAQILEGAITDNSGSTPYFLGTKNHYHLFNDIEYTLKYTAVYNPQYVSSSTTTYTTSDSGSLKIFLSGIGSTTFDQVSCITNQDGSAGNANRKIVEHPVNSKIVSGMSVSETSGGTSNIPANTTIIRIVDSTHFELSDPATGTATVTLTFSGIPSAVINDDKEPVVVGDVSKYGLLVDDFKTDTKQKSLYEREVNFKVPRTGATYLRLKPESGFWSFGNIQITPTVDVGFSPDEIIFDAPNNLLTGTTNDFKIQFLNFKDEPIDYEILTSAVNVSASAGTKGTDGAAGAGIVYRGDWATSTAYYKSNIRRDVVKGSNNEYYLCKEDHTSAGDKGDPPNGTNASTYWEAFGATFSSVATDVLFSQDVYAHKTINVGALAGNANAVIALNADTGNSNANPYIAIGGITAYGANNGIFLGYKHPSSEKVLSLVNSDASKYLKWDGSTLDLKGEIHATTGTFTGNITANNLTLSGTSFTIDGATIQNAVFPSAAFDKLTIHRESPDTLHGSWFGGQNALGANHDGYVNIFNDSTGGTANRVVIGDPQDGLGTSTIRLHVYGSVTATGTVSGQSGVSAGPRFEAQVTNATALAPHFYANVGSEVRGGIRFGSGEIGGTEITATGTNASHAVISVRPDSEDTVVDAFIVSGSAGGGPFFIHARSGNDGGTVVSGSWDAGDVTSPIVRATTSLNTPAIKSATGTSAMTIANNGDVTFNGSTTIIDSTTLTVDDKNIELGSVGSPSDSTADGGGITLKGASDKTILWTNSLDSWVFNQGITVGVDDTGYDVKFFGATTGAHMLWDESVNRLSLVGAAGLSVAGTTFLTGAVTIGGIGSGVDVTFYSDTSGDQMIWSAGDQRLTITGGAGQTAFLVNDGDVIVGTNSTLANEQVFRIDESEGKVGIKATAAQLTGNAYNLNVQGSIYSTSITTGGLVNTGDIAATHFKSTSEGSGGSDGPVFRVENSSGYDVGGMWGNTYAASGVNKLNFSVRNSDGGSSKLVNILQLVGNAYTGVSAAAFVITDNKVTTGLWNGDEITAEFGGTGRSAVPVGNLVLGNNTGVMSVVDATAAGALVQGTNSSMAAVPIGANNTVLVSYIHPSDATLNRVQWRNYLTLDGSLTVAGQVLIGNGDGTDSNDVTVALGFSSDSTTGFYKEGTHSLGVVTNDQAHTLFQNDCLRPYDNAHLTLGTSAKRWSNGYFSGTVYANAFSGTLEQATYKASSAGSAASPSFFIDPGTDRGGLWSRTANSMNISALNQDGSPTIVNVFEVIADSHSNATTPAFVITDNTVTTGVWGSAATTIAVASGGTGATSLDDITSANDRISVTAGADTIIGGNCTLTFNQGNITGTGALNAGSITNGFSSIDVGSNSIATSGNLSSGTLTTTDILIGDGSASTPAINFSGDTDTGIYRVGNDIIGFVANGASRIEIGTSFIKPTSNGAMELGLTGQRFSHAYFSGTVYASSFNGSVSQAQVKASAVGSRAAPAFMIDPGTDRGGMWSQTANSLDFSVMNQDGSPQLANVLQIIAVNASGDAADFIITDGAVTTGVWSAGALQPTSKIVGSYIADDTIDSQHYANASIDHVHLANDVIDGSNVQDNSIDSEHYVNASIDAAHIANNTITATQIAANAVGNSEMADDAVGAAELASNAVVNASVASGAAIATSKLSGAVTSIASHGLAASATTDTTNASNISSGTLNNSRLPAAATTITSVGTLSSLAVSGDLTIDSPTLHVDSSANEVGIGTTSPSGQFHVYSNSASEINWTFQNAGAGTGQIVVKGGNDLYHIIGRSSSAGFMMVAGDWMVQTHDGSWNTGLYQKNNGSVGINETNPSQKLHVDGSGLATDWIADSDIRLKNVTGPITDALSTVNKLSAIRYTWKDERDDKEHIGFSAQEVLELVPEAVHGSEETEYGISYGKLVPVLVEAIKELTAEVEALKKKVGE